MTSIIHGPSAVIASSGLADLAEAASRALTGAVVITTRNGPQSLVAAFAGIQETEAVEVAYAFRGLERKLSSEGVVRVSAKEACHGSLPETLIRHGFGGAASTVVQLGRRRIGAIHLLRGESSPQELDELLCAFARHAAVTVMGRPGAHDESSLSPALLEPLLDLSLSQSFSELIEQLDALLARLFGQVSSGIMLWDPSRDVLQMVAGSFGANEKTTASYQIPTTNSWSNAARVFVTGDPYLSNDAVGDPAIIQDYVKAFGIKRVLSARLVFRGNPIGVLHLLNKDKDFTVEDLWEIEPLIAPISGAVESARTLVMMKRRERVEQLLAQAAVAIAGGYSVHDALTPTIDGLCRVMDANLVVLVPTAADPVVWRYADVDTAYEQRVISRASKHPLMRAEITGPMQVGDPGSAVFHVPVNLGAQRVGTLSILRPRAEPFLMDERDALSRLAKLTTLAWAAERYQQQRAELARVDERQRIAADLHDDVAQLLFAAQMALDASLEIDDLDERAAANVVHARALLLKSDDAIRGVIRQLARPPSVDLAVELESIVGDIEHEFGLAVRLEISEMAATRSFEMRPAVRDIALKVAREGLVNAAKHAGPCRIVVGLGLTRSGRILLTVADDGFGVSAAGGSGMRYGLTSIRRLVRSNGGQLRVSSTPGGTMLRLSLPL